MAGFFGADIEHLRLLGRELGHQAEQLDAITSRLTTRVTSVEWRGLDARKFIDEWNARLSVSLRATANVLRDEAGRVEANAQQQEQASGGSGAGTGKGSVEPVDAAPVVVPAISPDFVFGVTRDAVNQKIPGTSWSYGQVGGFIPGADLVLDVRDLADSFQRGEVPVHNMVDIAAGALRTGGPVAYGAGVAVGVWNTVIDLGVKADFPNTWQTNLDYIASDPWGAVQAAGEGIVNGLPEIIKNFKFW